jgi:predicted enzyme related to lactoylglutathione lyase
VWNELYTRDPAASIAFYAGLAGYSERSMQMADGGTYHVLERDGRGRAGVMKPPAPDGAALPMPQAWMPYVQVTSCDETIAKAKQLGANIHVAGEDVPGIGRLGIFTDPLGGMLGVLQPAM